jgi:hypothetical protein
MNAKERKELGYFPKALDAAIIERFGPETDSYVTNFIAEGPLREEINTFIDGFIAGNLELSTRLLSL